MFMFEMYGCFINVIGKYNAEILPKIALNTKKSKYNVDLPRASITLFSNTFKSFKTLSYIST
jgi:hypothetical protein